MCIRDRDNTIRIRHKSTRADWVSPYALLYADGDYYLIAVLYSAKTEEQSLVPVSYTHLSTCVFSLTFVVFQLTMCLYFTVGMILRGAYYKAQHLSLIHI